MVIRSHARNVAARPVQAGDKAVLHRIAADCEDDRNRRGGRLGRKCRAKCAACDDHGHLTATRSAASAGKPIVLTFRPAVFDRHVLALDIAGFAEALTERGDRSRALWANPSRGTRSPASPAAARAPRAATPLPRRPV